MSSFEAFVTQPRASLAEYLELHALVEPFQTLETLPYFVSKLVRGAYVFEGICYLELRHTPYYRTDPALSQADRIAQMRDVVIAVGEAGHDPRYPLLMRQILCMHSRLPYEVNRATLDLAAEPAAVCLRRGSGRAGHLLCRAAGRMGGSVSIGAGSGE